MSNPHLAKNPDVAAEQTADKADEARNKPMRALADMTLDLCITESI